MQQSELNKIIAWTANEVALGAMTEDEAEQINDEAESFEDAQDLLAFIRGCPHRFSH